jgi:hypothetical protein
VTARPPELRQAVIPAIASLGAPRGRTCAGEDTGVAAGGPPDEAAFADLVTGVLAVRRDLVSERFDSALEAARRAGLTSEAARELRYWQRESVRAAVHHAATALPPALAGLAQAAQEAGAAHRAAERAWEDRHGSPTAADDLAARRRRLIVAGLTALPTARPSAAENGD